MLRSFLFVPAKSQMICKVGKLGADAYILDLEDSVEDEKKEEALILVEHFLESYDFEAPVFVRLNRYTFAEEAVRLSRYAKVGFMLPKFENAEYYGSLSEAWHRHEVIALVENPKGIINMQEIAGCSWVNGIAFGAEDYTAVANMENKPEMLMYQKSCLLTYAKAYEKYALDTPSFRVDSMEEFEKEALLAVRMGFDGKMAISPRHIAFINQAFAGMDAQAVEHIIEQYEACGAAVQVIDGKVYEGMHIEQLKRLLKTYKN